MTRLNLEFLINTSLEDILSNLNDIFEKLIQEIKSYLNLDLTYSSIKAIYCGEDKAFDSLEEDFYKLGVKETLKNNSLTIYISSNYVKFIRIILLREAYKCFIPSEIKDNETINIFINQKVEIDLQKSELIQNWIDLKRVSVISYDFMEAEFDRLDKFLRQESTERRPTPIQFLFSYLRKNIELSGATEEFFFSLEKKGFYDRIFEEYTRKYNARIYPDEILETIRIITKIFYKVKSYRSLLEYKEFFKEFKESNYIQTYLSLKKFTENMQWIKKNTFIAPTYQLNWFALEIKLVTCFIQFHPQIETRKIYMFVKQLPFFTIPTFSKNSFGIEIIGYFLFPKVYLKDIIGFLKKLELDGFIIKKRVYINVSAGNSINLNCVRSKNFILSPDKRDYKTDYEVDFTFPYGKGILKSNLSLFDWFLIDRIRNISITGLGFERRSEAINNLKSDIINEIESQRKLIKKVKDNLNKIHNNIDFRNTVLNVIDNNQSYGFFYIKQIINDYKTVIDLVIKILKENPSIKNYFQFQEFTRNYGLSKVIEDNIILINLKKDIIKDLISLFFKSKKSLVEKVEEYDNFYNLFECFYDLKLFSLDTIKSIIVDNTLIQKIFQSKEEKLKKKYESYKIYKITNQLIEQRLDYFLNNKPPVIHPNLLNTIAIAPLLAKYYPVLIIKDTDETREGIEKIKWLFPRVVIVKMFEYNTNDIFIFLRLLMPNLKSKEKFLLFSILFNLFKNNIIMSKSFLYQVFTENFSRKDFYDLEREDFFYTEDLFEQYYSNVQFKFNDINEPIKESQSNIPEYFWEKKTHFSSLFNKVEKRISKENINLNFSNLNKLLDYNKNLVKNIVNLDGFKHQKNEFFFINYIKAIKFIPSFQSFGFGGYYLYFYPIDLDKMDFRHFLHNSFQKIKFPANIDNSNSFLIKFIWPFRNPNNKLLNWIVKSKKSIREYCLFFIKKVFQIFHFNYNLSINEWDLDPNRFKIYFQNILFNPNYNLKIPKLKEFNFGDLILSEYFTPESQEYKALTHLYNWKSIDIKSYLGTRNYTMINHIIELLDKKLIFPIISLKNIDLKEKIYIILPNVKKEHIETILKIFSFFNIGYIYEIEGEYYIKAFPEEIKFENGLMIKLYLPDCQLDEFELLFDLIFKYLKIEHYVILNDLVDGKSFLKSIYGSLDFLKSYNPLKNLIWNNKDKRWMNQKLFTKKFEKIYPSLSGNN